MADSPNTFVFFFNDWALHPSGVNCGGGEIATLSVARIFARKGHRVIACANLPDGECTRDGIEFWNFGPEYNIAGIVNRLREIGPYSAFSATLALPFLFLKDEPNCLSKIVINHSPGALSSGIELRTVLHNIDRFVCVSETQKKMMLRSRGVEDSEIDVIQNGFDAELFPYAGPEQRNWNKMIFIGRVEPAKGVDLAIVAFAHLKQKFPELELSIYGDTEAHREFAERIDDWERGLPGITFHGKVAQPELAKALQAAGLLLFPSRSFESAGLAVLDAQASGCPVVAFDIGGVPEYLDPHCGLLVKEIEREPLIAAVDSLLSNRERLKEMSRQCREKIRHRTWERTAENLLQLNSEVLKEKKKTEIVEEPETDPALQGAFEGLLQSIQRVGRQSGL